MRIHVVLLLVIVTLTQLPIPANAQTLKNVFHRVNPSVVVIRTSEKEVASAGQLATVAGVGSGVLISADGKVMTASHVVHTADKITVEFLDGATVTARVINSEPQADVSLLQLERVPPGAVAAKFGNSDRVEIGDPIFIVGAPYGIGHTLTVGHISARHRPRTVYSALALAEFFQTDAAINQGNSGGPMFSMAGEVIGIVSHIISKSGGFEGLGFVVTSNMARQLLLERKSFWSGMSGSLLSDDLAKIFNLPQPAGFLVQRVAANSPSQLIGLRGGTIQATIDGKPLVLGGDIILKVQGFPIENDIKSYEKLQERLSRLRSGDQVVLTVLREGQVIDLTTRVP